MLSSNQVVKIREAVESWYTDTCNVYGTKKVKKDNITSFEDTIIVEEQPCRLSFSKALPTNNADGTSTLSQTIKLFISPNIDIKPGSNIEVIRGERKVMYKCSGEPAVYETHQEITLELAKERA